MQAQKKACEGFASDGCKVLQGPQVGDILKVHCNGAVGPPHARDLTAAQLRGGLLERFSRSNTPLTKGLD